MSLTPAQLATLKSAINAETDPVLVGYRTAGATAAMQGWYNAAGTYVVWSTSTPTSVLFDSVVWANLTPTDAPDTTQIWENRSLACQGKQFNLQTMLTGRESLGTGRQNIRAGLQDALTNVPSGVGGALIGAGWTAVKAAMQRFASRAEALYAIGTGTAAAPGVLVLDGSIAEYDIVQALYQ